ncbi:MAG: tetratricopeptide repeat protein [Candidatus Riflebacteria bacterium]|nr:tetratricopeptide repeat protein [Candidatus Riflebacteria bacterium]
MLERLNEFKKYAEALHTELGDLKSRPSWKKVCGCSVALANFPDIIIPHLNPADGLAFVFSAYPSNDIRLVNLRKLFDLALEIMPDEKFLGLAKFLTPDEITNALLPHLYDSGNKSSTTVYIAAKLNIILNLEVFKTFLATHLWSQVDLVNMSFLIIPEEKQQLITLLTAAIAATDSQAERTSYSSFTHILTTTNPQTPMLPELPNVSFTPLPELPKLPGQSVSNPPTQASTELKKKSVAVKSNTLTKNNEKTAPKTNAVPNLTSLSDNKTINDAVKKIHTVFKSPKVKSAFSQNVENYAMPVTIGLVVIIIGTLLLVIFTPKHNFDDGATVTSAAIPKSWTDASSNRIITTKYLEADNDYRMGEIYLSRNLYIDAQKLFKDALRRDSTHLLARIRSGYCHLQLKEHTQAFEQFEEAQKQAPEARFLNMYIARTYKGMKKYSDAIRYYEAELKLEFNLEVGVEFATFLKTIGESNRSMEVLSEIQEKYPDKIIVLASEKDSEEKSE